MCQSALGPHFAQALEVVLTRIHPTGGNFSSFALQNSWEDNRILCRRSSQGFLRTCVSCQCCLERLSDSWKMTQPFGAADSHPEFASVLLEFFGLRQRNRSHLRLSKFGCILVVWRTSKNSSSLCSDHFRRPASGNMETTLFSCQYFLLGYLAFDLEVDYLQLFQRFATITELTFYGFNSFKLVSNEPFEFTLACSIGV